MSDLFFNFPHPNLDAAYAADAEPEEIDAALKSDAKDFSAMTGADVDWLVSDYNSRV